MTARIKPPKIKHVTQKHDKGCVVACIAMVLGWDYDRVVREFQNDFDAKGISTDFAKEFICDHGFSVIEKRGTGYIDLESHNKRMMVPFAPIHMITVRQFIDLPKHSHAFVTDAKGVIYEPKDVTIRTVAFYEVRHVMGFWQT